jgi:peptide/nickel transport system substrate-binding protein
MDSRHRAHLVWFTALSALTASGCDRFLSSTAPPRPTVSVVAQWEPSTLEPSAAGYIYTRMQMAETLVNTDDEGHPTPGLATEWESSSDRLTWHFRLRTGVRFHDGTPLDGTQTARVLNRARQRTGSLSQAPIVDIVPASDGIDIRLSRPYSLLPAVLAHSSTQILAASAFGENGSVRALIGTGPYKLTRMSPPQSFDVELSNYWRGPTPAIAAATYLAVGRAETRALLGQSGNADLVYNLDAMAVQRLTREQPRRILSMTTPRTVILKLNAGHPFFADERARQALSYAIDRTGIAEGILRDRRLAASQLMPPTITEWHVDTVPPLATDVSRARALLHEIGWRPGDNGILTRNGQRFIVELQVPTDRPELSVVGAALQAQLLAIGIDLRIVMGNTGDIPLMHYQGTLQAGLIARNYATFNDPAATLAQDFARRGGDWGAMNWAEGGAVAADLEVLSAADDPQERERLRRDVVGQLQRELPVIPIAWYRQAVAVSDRLVGASLDPMERSYRLTDLRWAPAAER